MSQRFKKVLCAVTAAGLLGGCKPEEKPPAPPVIVHVATVSQRDVPIYSEWIGTLEGYVNAQIRAQVTGYLLKQNYAEGSLVPKGGLLFEIDPRTFQAALDQTAAKLAQDQAQLRKTELDVKRDTPLAKEQAISQQELDDAVQANLAAVASIKADEAAAETARLSLGFTKITSPIDGIAGVAKAQIGDLVGPATSVLTTVSTVDPIKVYFPMSEQAYLAYCRAHTNSVERATHESELELELTLADGTVYPEKGKFIFADRQVDANTGTILIAGQFPNPASVLRPGQFARVRAVTRVEKGALLVPQRAVTELQGSYQVDTVDATNTVHVRAVTLGDRIGSEWIVQKGVEPGDRVIVDGTQKVKEGAKVNPQPADPPPSKEK